MKCPNCGKNIKRTQCMFCGYILEMGHFIDNSKKTNSPLLKTYLGCSYKKIVNNKNLIQTFIFGPLYIAFKGFILQGIVLFLIDLSILICFFCINNILPTTLLKYLINIIIIVLNRILWMNIDNKIYICLLNKKLNIIFKENPNNYKEITKKQQKSHSDIVCFITTIIIISILFLFIFFILKIINILK